MRNFIAAGNEARVISRLYPGRDSGCLRRRLTANYTVEEGDKGIGDSSELSGESRRRRQEIERDRTGRGGRGNKVRMEERRSM